MPVEWVTAEEVRAALAGFVATMPGWETPCAYALGVAGDDALVDWRVVNYPNVHQLPGVVLGTVLGYRRGSATYWLDPDQFDDAIAQLEPAGACKEFEHPNLWAWQALRAERATDPAVRSKRIVVVFIGSEDDEPADDPQRQLRVAISETSRGGPNSD